MNQHQNTLPRTLNPMARLRHRAGLALVVTALLACSGEIQTAESDQQIVRVEEDWILQIGSPDTDSNGPQILNTISVQEDLDSDYAVFEINHSTQPAYHRGGMQLQAWCHGSINEYRDLESGVMLAHENETLRYTLAMEVDDGHVRFSILNGQSETWEEFGGHEESRVSLSTELTSLNSYRPQTSVANSGISYASHRVKRLALKEVRYFSASGHVRTESNERVVYSYSGGE